MKKDFFKSRKFKHGSVAAAITAVVIVLVVLLNIGLNALNNSYTLTFDLTANQFYGMSQETKDFVSGIDEEIEIIVLQSQEDFEANDDKYYKQASSIINQYPQYSQNISVQYVDLDENQSISAQYAQDSVQAGDVIVRTDDDYKILSSSDLFDTSYSYYSYTITASKAEQAITSAILTLTSDEKTKVSFITGYDEDDYTSLESLLEKNNYEISETKILTASLPSDAELVFIYAPLRDYDTESIDKLNQYMQATKATGGNIIYVANPDAGETPNLNSFLGKWGINVGSGNVFETNMNNLFSTVSYYYTIVQYQSNDYTSSLKNTTIPVAMPAGKEITLSNVDTVTPTELLYYSETAGVCPYNASADWQMSESDIKGPITAGAIATKTENDVDSSVCAFSSSLAFDSSILSRSALNNSSYFTNLFNTLSRKDNGIIIESKSVEYNSLNLNATQAIVIGVMLAVIIPIMLLFIGIFVWLHRRSK